MSSVLTSIYQELVDSYRPLVNEKTGLDLEIVVKSQSDIYNDRLTGLRSSFDGWLQNSNPLVRFSGEALYNAKVPLVWLDYTARFNLSMLSSPLFCGKDKGAIYVKDSPFYNFLTINSVLYTEEGEHYSVVHELAHQVHLAINPSSQSYGNRLLAEGFVEYFALDYAADIYRIDMGDFLEERKRKHFRERNTKNPYASGYRLISSLAKELGHEAVVEILKNPEIFYNVVHEVQAQNSGKNS